MQIITISRQTASGGEEIAAELSQRLGLKLIDRDYILKNCLARIADEHQLHMLQQSSKYYTKIANPEAENQAEKFTFAEYTADFLKNKAQKEKLLIIGLGAQLIFKNNPYALHIKVIASENYRLHKLKEKFGLHPKEAARTLELSDRKHRRYVWQVHEHDWEDPVLYHLVINSEGLDLDESLALLMNLFDLKKENPQLLNQKTSKESEAEDSKSENERVFGHQSEKEFAKILDMHQIKWEYEPTEFPLEWDPEGNVKMAFRPDFYLSEHDTYLELTTMKRKYTTEKNKKVRLLQKIYPHVKVKIVYKKDFEQLAEKFDLNKGGA